MDPSTASEGASYRYRAACSAFLVGSLLALTLQIFFFSPISPDPLELPRPFSFPTNTHLQRVTKLGEGVLKKPEDVCVDKDGIIYTASRDGWIRRLHRDGSWEDWRKIESDALLGMTVTRDGSLIVCDAKGGLLKVWEDGVAVLASHLDDGTKINFADDVIEAADGSLYFSDASTKFGFHNWYLDFLEGKPYGKLLKYDPSQNQTTVVLDGLYFANGVALSADQSYLVVCETFKVRCLKYWLQGKDKGKTEVFVDNLPGGPDNINLAPDGSFWIALLQFVPGRFQFVYTSRAFKHLLATFPSLFQQLKGLQKAARVVNVAPDGKIMRSFDDPNGKVMSFVTSAVEFEDHLYLGNLDYDFIGKLPLNAA